MNRRDRSYERTVRALTGKRADYLKELAELGVTEEELERMTKEIERELAKIALGRRRGPSVGRGGD